MHTYFKMWLEGWKVIWRLLVFRLLVLLLASPLILIHWLITKQLKLDGNSAGMTVYLLYAIPAVLIFYPFIYRVASILRGEFIHPRCKTKVTIEAETEPDMPPEVV